MADCRATYSEIFDALRSTVTDAEWNNVQRLLDAAERILGDNGIDYRTAIDDLKAGRTTEAANKLSRILDEQLTDEARDIARRASVDLLNEGKNLSNLTEINRRAATKRGTDPIVKKLRAIRDLVTSPAEGSVSLGYLLRKTVNDRINTGLYGELRAKFGDDYVKRLDDPNFRRDIAREYYAKIKGKGASATGNDLAKQYAEHLFDTVNEQRAFLNKLSPSVSYRQLGLPIAFDLHRANLDGRDNFVMNLASALDETVHGNLDRRRQIAQQVFDELNRSYGNLDWNRIGDLHPQDAGGAYAGEPVIEFKDADSWFNVNQKYGTQEFLAAIESKMTNWARKEAAIKRFGPNSRSNLEHLIRVTQDGTSAGQTEANRILAEYKNLMEPVPHEYDRLRQAITIGKNIEAAGHTGGALLSHLTAAPFIAHVAWHDLNTNGLGALTHAFTGGISKEAKELAKLHGVIADHMLGHMQDQFGLGVTDNLSRGVHFSANLADRVIRVSGLDWMMNSLKAGALTIPRSVIGKHLVDGTTWDNLPINLRAGLEKFNISKDDWASLSRANLDSNRHFNVFSLKDGQSNSEITLYDKMSAWLDDTVSRMVITPSDRDFGMLTLGTPQGSIQNLAIRTMMQFKVYPVAIWRRIIYRTATQAENSVTRRIANLAALGAMAIPVAAMKVQAEQYLMGDKPYAWNSPDLWFQSVDQTGLGGAFLDLLSDAGVLDPAISALGGQQQEGRDYVEVLGPLFGDVAKAVMHSTGALASGAAYATTGNYKSGQEFSTDLSDITKQLLHTVPGQNLWYASLVYNTLLVDTLQEAINPDGYRKTRNRVLLETKNRADSFLNPSQPGQNQNIIARGLEQLVGR